MAESLATGPATPLEKSPTGIDGLDLITGGGLPRGRTTLVIGSAGSGKTLLSVAFITEGIMLYDEPGVIISFEENDPQLATNVISLGYDLNAMQADGKLASDHVVMNMQDTIEAGPFRLDGLLVRIQAALDSVGAKRLMLDGIDTMLESFEDKKTLRAEFRRLVEWLRQRGITAVLTSEAARTDLLGRSTKEYVTDCLLHLDHRIEHERSTRRIRVVKYRGSAHGTNEYPFMINADGLHVLPITSVGLDYAAPDDFVVTGIDGLDAMLGGKGYYRGSSVLVSGMAGCGKTSLAARFVEAACQRGQRALYCSFEEGPQQIGRNMTSIGIDLKTHVDNGTLVIKSNRPTHRGLESHLVNILRTFNAHRPNVVVIDPISSLLNAGAPREVSSMLCRLIDHFKSHETTTVFTSLIDSNRVENAETAGVSSIMDAWLMMGYQSGDNGRRRTISVVKARGLAHCDHVHDYEISETGFTILPRDGHFHTQTSANAETT